MNKKAQGALEYLLLIGGAVLVASIVIALITGTTSGQKDTRAQVKCAVLTDCNKCVDRSTGLTDRCVIVMSTGDTWGEFTDITGGTRNTQEDNCAPTALGGDNFDNSKFQYCTTQKTI
jgi:hypothetical protein